MTRFEHVSTGFAGKNYPPEEADVVLLGIPFVSTSLSFPALYGPLMVREGLSYADDYYGNKDIIGMHKFCDLGDIDVAPGSYEITAARVRQTIKDILETNGRAFPIFIGGEHLMTLPIVEAIKPKTIIHFDAHPDLSENIEGVVHSHATWAYHASKLAKVVQIGVRSYSGEDEKVVKDNGILTFTPQNFPETLRIERPVHVTIDIDVFRAAFVETGFPEGSALPGEIFPILERLPCDSLDIMEIADTHLPTKTGFLAAEIIKAVLFSRNAAAQK